MKFTDLFEIFDTHEKCLKHLEEVRWGDKITCAYCNSPRITVQPKENRYKCRCCNRSFSVMVGTIFEATKMSMHKWFMAIYLIMDAKKGISSLQLARHLNVNKDTAAYVQRRIRRAMDESDLVRGVFELDEAEIEELTGKQRIKENEIQDSIVEKASLMTNASGFLGEGEIYRVQLQCSSSKFFMHLEVLV